MTTSGATRQANGYVLNVAAQRRDVLLDAAQSGSVVAEVVPDFSHTRSHPLLCFVGFEDTAITHLALGRQGWRAATAMRRLNLEGLTRFPTPVSHDAVIEKLQPRFKPHVAPRLEAGGLLPPASFAAVVEAIRQLLPESSALLERFSARRKEVIAALSTNTRRALAYQKETLATALAFAGIDRTTLLGWQPSTESGPVQSFLDGLKEARLREDQILSNDLTTFPGFELVKSMRHASAVFTNDRVTLTVVMANRNPLEEQTGADLIYRNETYGSFVIVQYKTMRDEPGGARFRLPNAQLARELQRMEVLWNQLQLCDADSGLGGYRLNADLCFLKLCPRVVFDPDSVGLIRGMYLPLEYWRRLEVDPSIDGPKGGRAVSFDNVGRYFNNTSFAELVAGGWVGTTLPQTVTLDSIIRDIVATGRTVTIAVKRNLSDDSNSGAQRFSKWQN